MKLTEYDESNEDVFFLMYNAFNDFYLALQRSSTYYVEELSTRSQERKKICLTLLLLAVSLLVVSFLILMPVVRTVNKQKDLVLLLFCDIDNGATKILATKCERFLTNLNTEEGNDDIDSNEDIEGTLQPDDDDEYNLLSQGGKKMKKIKGKTKTDVKFFIKFMVALLFILAYYLANYLSYIDTIKTTLIFNTELNTTCVTEPFYWFTLNT